MFLVLKIIVDYMLALKCDNKFMNAIEFFKFQIINHINETPRNIIL